MNNGPDKDTKLAISLAQSEEWEGVFSLLDQGLVDPKKLIPFAKHQGRKDILRALHQLCVPSQTHATDPCDELTSDLQKLTVSSKPATEPKPESTKVLS